MRVLLIALMVAGCAPTMPEMTGNVEDYFRRVVAYCEAKVNWSYCGYPYYECDFKAYVEDDKGTVRYWGTDRQRFSFDKCMAEVKERLSR